MSHKPPLFAIILAILVPGTVTWLFFDVFPGASVTKVLYTASKIFIVFWPIMICFRHIKWRPVAPTKEGIVSGLGLGLLVSVSVLLLYFFGLKDSSVFASADTLLRDKMSEFGVNTVLQFVGLALFISLVNSSLEEYYWRWFIFKGLTSYITPLKAGLVSSIGFMFHHIIVLNHYLPDEHFWTAIVPFTLCTGIGGGIWCYVYHRTQSLYSPWISHLIIDLAIMTVGFDLLF